MMNRNGTKNGTLDLATASKFLNIREPMLAILAEQGRVPARKVGKQWRFSRIKLDQWLQGPMDPTIALLRQAGTCKDDPDLMQILADIYKARGRPEREED